MSDFLMVIPSGWTEIPDPTLIMAEESWTAATNDDAREWLKTAGLMQDGFTVADMRTFKDSGLFRVWIVEAAEE